MPSTVDDLRALNPFEFQNRVIDYVSGTQSGRKSGDMGIDGWTFALMDPVQVKEKDKVGRPDVDTFQTAVARARKTKGFLIALGFTRDAREEVARARRQAGLEIYLVTIAEMLEQREDGARLMGLHFGFGQDQIAPLPKFEPTRHTAEELVRSAAGERTAGS
jgi:hypothetical protein